MKHSKIKTEKEVVNFAKNAKNISLIDLKGKLEFSSDYKYKKLREYRYIYHI